MKKKVLLFIVIIVMIATYIIYKFNDNYNYGDYYDYLDNISYDLSNKFEVSKYSRGYYHYYDNFHKTKFSLIAIIYFSFFTFNSFLIGFFLFHIVHYPIILIITYFSETKKRVISLILIKSFRIQLI